MGEAVGASVGEAVGASVGASVGDAVGEAVEHALRPVSSVNDPPVQGRHAVCPRVGLYVFTSQAAHTVSPSEAE